MRRLLAAALALWLLRWLAGEVGIHIDRTFTLDELPVALAHVGEGHALGKVVVTPT